MKNLLKNIKIYIKRTQLLRKRGWYISLSGNYCHPHCMVSLEKKEILKIPENFFHELANH